MRLIKLIFHICVTLLGIAVIIGEPVSAQEETSLESDIDSGSVVCPPGIYWEAAEECLPFGPSEILSRSARSGIPYPLLPLPAFSPPVVLADLPYQYFKINSEGTSFYATMEDAAADTPTGPHMYPSSHLYVSYTGLVSNENLTLYHLRSEWWIRPDGGKLARYDPPFQGLLFSSTPQNSFGWILGEVRSRPSPGGNVPENDTTYYRYTVVQIYASQEVEGITWNLIGPDEWVESRNIARVDPVSTPPEGIATGRWIAINLFEQTMTVFENNHLIFATIVSTGVDRFWTRPGLFQIFEKKETETMSNSVTDDFYYLEDVPWTMYFDDKRALHGAYWHNWFGYPQSHGCVNLSLGDSHWLYNWAGVGEYVYVYDPSGNTPVDLSLYGAGSP